jgi:hypothetical protein
MTLQERLIGLGLEGEVEIRHGLAGVYRAHRTFM